MSNKAEIIVRDLPKANGLESANVYIKQATVYFAAVHEVKPKYQSNDKEYSATVFIDEAAKDKLLDEVLVNKTFAEVGVTKTSKPPRRIKFPLSTQVEEGKGNYDLVKGLWGFSVAKPEFSKKGNPLSVNVIDLEGNTFTENLGNGTVVNLKLFGYRNVDGQLVVTLDTVQVVEHVPYEGKGGSDSVEDDVLGVSYKVNKAPVKEAATEAQEAPQAKPKETEAVGDDFDDEILPF